MSILKELQAALKTKTTDLVKLAVGANELNQGGWDSLSDEAQAWVNGTLEERDKAKEEDREPEYEALDADAESEAETEAEAEPVKAKGNAKAKAKAEAKEPVSAKAKTTTAKKAKPPRKAAKKAAKGKTGVSRPRLPGTAKIVIVAKENPYREGSIGHKAFAKYKNGATLDETLKALASIKTKRDGRQLLAYDRKKGYVKVEAPKAKAA